MPFVIGKIKGSMFDARLKLFVSRNSKCIKELLRFLTKFTAYYKSKNGALCGGKASLILQKVKSFFWPLASLATVRSSAIALYPAKATQ